MFNDQLLFSKWKQMVEISHFVVAFQASKTVVIEPLDMIQDLHIFSIKNLKS